MAEAYKRRLRQILVIGVPNDRVSWLFDLTLFVLIFANAAAVILESVPTIAAAYQGWFDAFEFVSVLIFSVEYGFRVWLSAVVGAPHSPLVQRLRYMVTPMALIDLIAILPFYLSIFFVFDLRFLRVVRLFRLLKLTRYSKSILMLLQVFRDEARPICAALFILSLLIVLTSSFAYLAEHDAQPDAFGSIPQAMWWAVITMTTVGYGDVTPVTTMGKFIGAGIGIIGIGMVALPAGLLAAGFTAQLHARSGDKNISAPSRPQQSGGSKGDMKLEHDTKFDVCPHCGANGNQRPQMAPDPHPAE